MRGEEVVEPVRPSIHELAHRHGAMPIVGLQLAVADVQLRTKVLPDCLLAFGFGGASEAGEIIRFDPRKIILGLRIDHSEDRIGINFPMDVRDSPVVAHDGHMRGLETPSLELGRRCCGKEKKEREESGSGGLTHPAMLAWPCPSLQASSMTRARSAR